LAQALARAIFLWRKNGKPVSFHEENRYNMVAGMHMDAFGAEEEKP
jgi:hypothetical protein